MKQKKYKLCTHKVFIVAMLIVVGNELKNTVGRDSNSDDTGGNLLYYADYLEMFINCVHVVVKYS